MSWTRDVRPIAYRSLWETRERIWDDVKLWLAVTFLVAALSAWRGLPWRSITVLTIIALLVVLAGVFLWRFGRNIRHPDKHRAWKRGQTSVITERNHQGPAMMTVTLAPLKPAYGGRYRAEITDPQGNVWLEPEPIEDEQARLIRALTAIYPLTFPDAPPLESGAYNVRWLAGAKRGWHELLRYSEEVTLD
jgi:hypothetical protein